MILVEILLAAAVIFLVTVAWRWNSKRRKFNAMMREHERCNQRGIHKIFGCCHCGRQLFPLDERWSCGTCADWDLCGRCKRGTAGRTHVHRLFRDDLFPCVDGSRIEAAESVAEALQESLDLYAIRPCIGRRGRDGGSLHADFDEWFCYSDVSRMAWDLSCAIEIAAERKLEAHKDAIVVCGASSCEWLVSFYAGMLRGWIVVPLHASLEVGRLSAALRAVRSVRAVVVSRHIEGAMIEAINQLGADWPIAVVKIDDSEEAYAVMAARRESSEISERPAAAGGPAQADVRAMTWDEALSKGSRVPDSEKRGKSLSRTRDSEKVVLLLPTSGTSGVPKLTIVTDGMLRHQVRTSRTAEAVVVLAYEPLRQTLDVLSKGGRIGVFSGSLDRLLEDAQALRPTVFGAMPTTWQGLFCQFKQELWERERAAVDAGEGGEEKKARARKKLLAEWRKKHVLGNRLGVAITGGAPIGQEVLDFMSSALGCTVLNGYGCTEVGGLAGNGQVSEGANVMLLDCPELGYTTADKPRPRGEIVARTSRMTPGYFGDERATEAAFATIAGKRYFRTGDIGELFEGGRIRVIDRKSALVKLQQGVFVSPEALETLFGSTCGHLVSQVFIYGAGEMSSVGAVIVPTESLIKQLPADESGDDRWKAAKVELAKEFRRVGRAEGMPPWEIPSQIVVETERFSVWNGLLGTGGKLCRPALAVKYRGVFKPDLPCVQQPPVPALKQWRGIGGICGGLVGVICESLGVSQEALDPTAGLLSLGADSMRLAMLVSRIQQQFGVAIPLPALIKLPTLADLQDVVFGRRPAAADPRMAAEFFEGEVRDVWKQLEGLKFGSKPKPAEKVSVMLTGASGFLGAFLLQALLSEPHVEKVLCIVRAHGDSDARDRLEKNMEQFSCDRAGFATKAIALSGDLANPRLGLSAKQYERASVETSLVIHNGSMVNSAKDYLGHRESNVTGTKNVLEFAAGAGVGVAYVGTAGVLAGSGVSGETEDVPAKGLSGLGGYAQSKWVAERLVRLARAAGHPVLVFRPTTIIGDRKNGASNPRDFVNLVLCGMIKEGATCTTEGSPLPQVLNAVPADFVAEVIVRASLHRLLPGAPPSHEFVFNLVSDPTSLSEVVSHIRSHGYHLEEMPPEK